MHYAIMHIAENAVQQHHQEWYCFLIIYYIEYLSKSKLKAGIHFIFFVTIASLLSKISACRRYLWRLVSEPVKQIQS